MRQFTRVLFLACRFFGLFRTFYMGVLGNGFNQVAAFLSLSLAGRLARPGTGVRTAPVLIQRGAFVSTRAVILKGSLVGKFSIQGVGTVLSGKVPNSQIWAGNLARCIRQEIN